MTIYSQHQSKKRMPVLCMVLTISTALMTLVGCGTGTNGVTGGSNQTTGHATANDSKATSQTKTTNPPFRDRLKDVPATPDGQFQPLSANQATYSDITVYTENGQQVHLNAGTTPILFEAYWCPHCQRTLVLLNQNRSALKQFPVLVSMGFAPGTSLSQAVSITQQEMNYFHIDNVKEYYYLGADSKDLVPNGYPTMALPGQSGIVALAGEHTLKVWQQAVSSTK